MCECACVLLIYVYTLEFFVINFCGCFILVSIFNEEKNFEKYLTFFKTFLTVKVRSLKELLCAFYKSLKII